MLDFETVLGMLCATPTVSGTCRNARSLIESLTPYFDEITSDNARNLILYRKAKNAPTRKLMLDAHLDEVGFMVTSVTDDGYLQVRKVGGTDPAILAGAEVTVYGVKELFGVICPPDAQSDEDKKEKKPQRFYVDIGYRTEQAKKLVPTGSVVKFSNFPSRLTEHRLVGASLDNKSCAASLICAVSTLDPEKMKHDVYVTLSAGEEVGGGGAGCAAYAISPDLCIITDVNFALTPSLSADDCGKLGMGPMISLSAETDRHLTARIIEIAENASLPLQKSVEPTSTGTNADCVATMGCGIPTAVIGLPITGMHTYTEALSPRDVEGMISLIREIAYTEDMIGGTI